MVSASMLVQHTKWLEAVARPRVARAGAVAERAAHVDVLAQRPQRLQPPGPGADRHAALDARHRRRASTSRPTRTACSRSATTASGAATTSTSIVIDKQPEPQWLDMAAAEAHCARGRRRLGVGGQRGPTTRRRSRHRHGVRGRHPDARDDGRGRAPARARPRPRRPRRQRRRPHDAVPARRASARAGPAEFVDTFTADVDVVFAFHGYPRELHQILHGRPGRIAVPRARLPRAGHDHDAVRHGRAQRDEPLPPRPRSGAPGRAEPRTACPTLMEHCNEMLERHRAYIVEHFEDMPEVRDWTWA